MTGRDRTKSLSSAMRPPGLASTRLDGASLDPGTQPLSHRTNESLAQHSPSIALPSAVSSEGDRRAAMVTAPAQDARASLKPGQLNQLAATHGYDPHDPRVAIYARSQAAAAGHPSSTVTAEPQNGAKRGVFLRAEGGAECDPSPVPATPPPPPRPPSPDPYVHPALARMAATVPLMTHTILRYARSNAGLPPSDFDGQDGGRPVASSGTPTNATHRRGPGRRREQRTFTRGLAAVLSPAVPVALATLVRHLDVDDLCELGQTCRSIRTALRSALGQELILHRFLHPLGYTTWPAQWATLHAATTQVGLEGAAYLPPRGEGGQADPVPLTTKDIFYFALACKMQSEYAPLAQLVLRYGREVDTRLVQLAKCTTRAYSRVVARLRAQLASRELDQVGGGPATSKLVRGQAPGGGGALEFLFGIVRKGAWVNRAASASSTSTGLLGTNCSGEGPASTSSSAPDTCALPNERSIRAWEWMGLKRRVAEQRAKDMPSVSQVLGGEALRSSLRSVVRSPHRTGLRGKERAPVWWTWVPATRFGEWLEDDELARVESELSAAGIRGHIHADHLMAEGDIVWDVALGGGRGERSEGNHGKFLYDGTFVRCVPPRCPTQTHALRMFEFLFFFFCALYPAP